MSERRDGRRRGQHIDWPTIRAAYIEGNATDPDGNPLDRAWPTQAEIAALHGISARAVATRSAREGWTAQREAHQAEVDRARREVLAQETAGKVTSIDRRALTSADAGLSLINQRMTFLVRAEIARGENAGQGVSAAELAALGLAGRRWLQVKDGVMGRGVGPEESGDVERDLRVAEGVLAAKLAAHRAAREGDEADLPEV